MRMPKARLGHVTMPAKAPEALAAFYCEMFGMSRVGGSANGNISFLASYPEQESHDLAWVRDPSIAHIALKVGSLTELRQAYRELKDREVPVLATQNHGVAFAIYFSDPEGNLIELYWPTSKKGFRLPFIRPLDLDQSEEVLTQVLADTEPRVPGSLSSGPSLPLASPRVSPSS
jgi:catechol 2,3-dioxygenase